MRRRPSFLEFITLMLFMLIAPVGAFGDSSTVYNDLIVPDVNVEAKRREDLIGIRVTPNGGYELYMCFFDVWPQTPIKTTNLREIRRSALKAGLRKTLGFKKQDTDYPLIVIKLVFDNNYTLLEASLQRTSGQVAAFLTHSEASLALQQSNSPFYEDLTTAYKLAKQLARAEITMKKAEAKDMIRSFVEFLRNNLIRLVNNKNQPFIFVTLENSQFTKDQLYSNPPLSCFIAPLENGLNGFCCVTSYLRNFPVWVNMGILIGVLKLNTKQLSVILNPKFPR